MKAGFGVEDGDSFAFIVPQDTELISAQVESATTPGETGVYAIYQLYEGSLDYKGGIPLNNAFSVNPGTSLQFLTQPLGAGDYNLSLVSLMTPIGPSTSSYLFTFTLRALDDGSNTVPEPGTLALIASALLAAGFARRKRA